MWRREIGHVVLVVALHEDIQQTRLWKPQIDQTHDWIIHDGVHTTVKPKKYPVNHSHGYFKGANKMAFTSSHCRDFF